MPDINSEPMGSQLARLVTAIRAETAQALARLNLTLPQYMCMRILNAQPRRSNAALARIAGVSPQYMHTVVQSLEQAYLVKRFPPGDFGRLRPVQLTARGTRLLARGEQAVHDAEEPFLAGITPRQQIAFKRALAVLAAPDGAASPAEPS